MRHCMIFIMGIFVGGVISSSWWAASRWGWIEYGKGYDALWSIPAILTIFTLIGIGVWLKDSFEND
jgi:hypothetical protein